MIKWWVNEIKLRNFTLSLNEKLYLAIFTKKIHRKYFQNLQMVLRIYCNDDKICEKSCLSYFGIMYPQVLLSHLIFFGGRARWNFGKVVAILSIIPTASCSAERLLSVLWRPKTNLRSTMGQDRLNHLALLCFECAYVNRLDIEKVIDEFSSKKVVPSSFSNQFSDKKTLIRFVLNFVKMWVSEFCSCQRES